MFGKAIRQVNSKNSLYNKSVHKHVSIFNEILINIFINFFPNKVASFDDRDPPWKNGSIKRKTKLKKEVYKTYI